MSTVKRQHYVWRNYLRPWSENDKIWSLLKPSNKIIYSDLMGVAQEKYFYRLIDLSESEIQFIKRFITESCHPSIRGLNFDFLTLFTSTSELKKHLAISLIENKNEYEEEIRKLEINLMEIAHGKIESLGTKLIKYRTLDDLKTMEEDDYFFDAIMFLCFQYFRTNIRKKAALESFIGKPHEDFVKRSWNIFSYILSTILARNISFDQNLSFTLIENTTNTSFLTCDQPIFNIHGEKVDENGNVEELELYYPLCPKASLLIGFKGNARYSSISADLAMVGSYNKKVFEMGDFYIFSNKQDQLKQLVH